MHANSQPGVRRFGSGPAAGAGTVHRRGPRRVAPLGRHRPGPAHRAGGLRRARRPGRRLGAATRRARTGAPWS